MYSCSVHSADEETRHGGDLLGCRFVRLSASRLPCAGGGVGRLTSTAPRRVPSACAAVQYAVTDAASRVTGLGYSKPPPHPFADFMKSNGLPLVFLDHGPPGRQRHVPPPPPHTHTHSYSTAGRYMETAGPTPTRR